MSAIFFSWSFRSCFRNWFLTLSYLGSYDRTGRLSDLCGLREVNYKHKMFVSLAQQRLPGASRAPRPRRIWLITIHIWQQEDGFVLSLLEPTRLTLSNDFSVHYLQMAAVNEDRVGAKVTGERGHVESWAADAQIRWIWTVDGGGKLDNKYWMTRDF